MNGDDTKQDDDDDVGFDAWFDAEYPPTEEDRAESAALAHVPDRDEVRALLTKYFIGPITDEAFERAYTEFRAKHDDNASFSFYMDQFNSRFNGRGDSWREELSHNRQTARPIDLVVLIAGMEAEMDPSRPQPRKYCPTAFVGTWEQVEPAPAPDERVFWQFLADGTFRSNTKDTWPDRVEWWVERHHDDRCTIVLGEGGGWSGWNLTAGKPPTDEIVGHYLGQHENTPFRLRRVKP